MRFQKQQLAVPRWALCGVFVTALGLTAQTNDAFERGSALYRAGNCEAAIPVLRSAAANPGANLLLGRCYVEQKKYKEAAEAFAAYRKSNEADPLALILETQAMERDGRGKEAAAALEDFVKRNPNESEVRNALGDIYVRMGRAADASAQYKAVLEQHPDDPGAHIGLGLAATQGEQWAAAVQEFEKARATVPEDARVLTGIGDAYIKLGKCDQAVEPLRQALRLAPDDFPLAKRTASCYAQLKKPTEVLAVLRTGTPAEAADEETTALMVEAYKAAGNAGGAMPYLKTAAPSNVLAHVELGHLLYAAGRTADAKMQYAEAVKLRPDQPEINERLGDIAVSEKNLTEARKDYEAATRTKNPADAVRMKLARVCFEAAEYPCTKDALTPVKDPKFTVEADTLRTRIAVHDKNWDEAGSLADKLLALDRKNVEMLKVAGEVKLHQSQDPNHFDAADLFEEALALSPRDKELRYQIVQIYANANDESRLPRARDLLTDYINGIEKDPQAYLLLGNVYFGLKDVDNAEASFKQGFDLMPSPIPPEFSSHFLAYGNLLFFEKKYEDARIEQMKAVDVDKNNDEALYYLGLANLQLKRMDEVNANLDKLVEMRSPRAADLQAAMEKAQKTPGRRGN